MGDDGFLKCHGWDRMDDLEKEKNMGCIQDLRSATG